VATPTVERHKTGGWTLLLLLPAIVTSDAPDTYGRYRLNIENTQVLWVDQCYVLLIQLQIQTFTLNIHPIPINTIRSDMQFYSVKSFISLANTYSFITKRTFYSSTFRPRIRGIHDDGLPVADVSM